jgi:hypothetical protein
MKIIAANLSKAGWSLGYVPTGEQSGSLTRFTFAQNSN